jgi:tetratricopeptide (TPR) repeat protein
MMFVNRESELHLIDTALGHLMSPEHQTPPPLLVFFGVKGIGKTALLQQVEERCASRQLPSLWIDGSVPPLQCWHEMLRQLQQMSEQVITLMQNEDVLIQLIQALAVKLTQGPLVLLFDLDHLPEESWQWIDHLLSQLKEGERSQHNLFVAMTSTTRPEWLDKRSVGEFQAVLLGPLDEKSCWAFLDHMQIEVPLQDAIISWTQGYPVAMLAMVEAMRELHLNPLNNEDQQPLLNQLVERVIRQGILAGAMSPEEQENSVAILSLLSVPRRFNLILIQNLIEHFGPQALKRPTSTAYISLPDGINQLVHALKWNVTGDIGAGFALDVPIRSLFLLKHRIEQPEQLIALHSFLAACYTRFAKIASGSDRLHYLCEYLYHRSLAQHNQDLPRLLQEMLIEFLIEESPAVILQFAEILSQDQTLSSRAGVVQTALLRGSERVLLQGQFKAAERAFQVCLDVSKTANDERGRIEALLGISKALLLQGRDEEALRRGSLALYLCYTSLQDSSERDLLLGSSLCTLGVIYSHREQFFQAERCFQESLMHCRRSEDAKGIALSSLQFAQLQVVQGHGQEAQAWLREMEATVLPLDEDATLFALRLRGQILIQQKHLLEAVEVLQQAYGAAHQAHAPYHTCDVLVQLAEALLLLDQYEQAEQALHEVEQIAEREQYPFQLGCVEEIRAQQHYNRHEYKEAFSHYGRHCQQMKRYNYGAFSQATRAVMERLLYLPKGDQPLALEILLSSASASALPEVVEMCEEIKRFL